MEHQNSNNDIFYKKYNKYKKKYLNLKMTAGSSVSRNITLNISLNKMAPLDKYKIPDEYLSKTIEDILKKIIKPEIKYNKMLELVELCENNKYSTIKIIVKNIKSKKILVINENWEAFTSRLLSDYNVSSDSVITIILRHYEITPVFVSAIDKIQEISSASDPNNRNLIYISIGSFINIQPDEHKLAINKLIRQQYLPLNLADTRYSEPFNNIYIMLIDPEFKEVETRKPGNIKVDGVLQEIMQITRTEYLTDKLTPENILIYSTLVPNTMSSIEDFIRQFTSDNLHVFYSASGNNLTKITI